MTKTVAKTSETAKDVTKTLALRGPRLPYHPAIEERFGVDKASWKALVEAIFPNATTTESVLLALSYCRARKLDPFKRNVHIVPIWSKDLGAMVDTVWPGIGELRTTAFRTGEYAGRCATDYGPDVTQKVGVVEITFPSWAQVTVIRMIRGEKVEFCGPRAYWLETYATRSRADKSPNDMWATRPRGQIEKCAEAAALRAAFPEEVGGDFIPEEVQHDLSGNSSSGRLNGSKVSMRSLESLTTSDITLVDEPEGYEVSEQTAEQTEAAKAEAEAIAKERAEIEADEAIANSKQDA